jgi:hypothetical protein
VRRCVGDREPVAPTIYFFGFEGFGCGHAGVFGVGAGAGRDFGANFVPLLVMTHLRLGGMNASSSLRSRLASSFKCVEASAPVLGLELPLPIALIDAAPQAARSEQALASCLIIGSGGVQDGLAERRVAVGCDESDTRAEAARVDVLRCTMVHERGVHQRT